MFHDDSVIILNVCAVRKHITCWVDSSSTKIRNLYPDVQSPISTNPGLTLNKTYRVKPGHGCSKPD